MRLGHVHTFAVAILLGLGSWRGVIGSASPPGSEGARPFGYLDNLYAGMAALYEIDTERAIRHFRDAGRAASDDGRSDVWRERVERWVEALQAETEEPVAIPQLAAACEWAKFWFLAEMVRSVEDLSENRKARVLDAFSRIKLRAPPWNVPEELALRLVQFRADACGKVGTEGVHFYVKAVADYEQVADSNAVESLRPDAMLKMANHYYQLKDYARAIPLYDAILSKPEYVHFRDLALLNRGKSCVMLKQYAEARQMFTELIQKHPESQHVKKAKKYLKYVSRRP